MKKDFLTITPDSGGGGTTDVTVQASQNSGNSRTSTITISGGGITRTINVSQTAARRTVTEVQYNFDSFAGTSNGWISAQGTIEARFSNQFITPEFRLRKAVYEGDTLISENFSKSGNNKITVVPTNTSYYDVTILSEYGERVQFMKKSGAPSSVSCYYDITVQYMGAGGTATASFHLYN